MKWQLVIVVIMGIILETSAQAPINAEDISPLLIGESIPNFTLKDENGNDIKLQELLNKQPTVLVFYRGGWCPYCNMQLSGLVDIEDEIVALNYQIIAISPDDFKNIKVTGEKNSMNYKLFSDPDGKLVQAIGIAFQTPKELKGFIASKEQKGKTSDVMPVPTVMVVDKECKILFEYINPNYKERISGKMLIAVLESLKND